MEGIAGATSQSKALHAIKFHNPGTCQVLNTTKTRVPSGLLQFALIVLTVVTVREAEQQVVTLKDLHSTMKS